MKGAAPSRELRLHSAGLGDRACRDFAFTSLEAPRVVSIIRDTNEASKRVAERIGLRPESTFVKRYYGMDMPHIVYALDRGDFYKKAGEPDGQ